MMQSDEIVWLRENPFEFNRRGLRVTIDVCGECEEPHVRVGLGVEGRRTFGYQNAASLDTALAAVVDGMASTVGICVHAFAREPRLAVEKEKELDEIWDVIRAVSAYQLRVQKALHLRVTAPGSRAVN